MVRVMSGAKAATAVFLVEHAEELPAEEDFPDAGLDGFQTHDFIPEGTSDKALASLPEESAIGGDAAL